MPMKTIRVEILTSNGGKSISEAALSIDVEEFEGIEIKDGNRILKFPGVTITIPEEFCHMLNEKKE
jgi:hypothetical protein